MKKTVYGIIISAAVILGICCVIFLPETVAVQIGFNGQVSNTMPKWLAILIPMAMSVGCSALELSDKEKINSKMLVIAGVGILFMVFSLVLNGIG